MSDEVTVLFANEAFYAAFAGRDFAAMDTLWSRGFAITCIHPGGLPLSGRDAVMESWKAILTAPDSPAIVCWNASAYVLYDAAYVLCNEQLQRGFLVATNVFIRENGGWRMVHHRAGACPPPGSLATASDRGPLQ